jgi:hypothetical protein
MEGPDTSSFRQALLRLEFDDILNACLSNKQFQTICANEGFWQTKFRLDFPEIFASLTAHPASWRGAYEQIYRRARLELPSSVYRLIEFIAQFIWVDLELRGSLSILNGVEVAQDIPEVEVSFLVFMTFPPPGLENLMQIAQRLTGRGIGTIHGVELPADIPIDGYEVELLLLDFFRKVYYPEYRIPLEDRVSFTEFNRDIFYENGRYSQAFREGRLRSLMRASEALFQADPDPISTERARMLFGREETLWEPRFIPHFEPPVSNRVPVLPPQIPRLPMPEGEYRPENFMPFVAEYVVLGWLVNPPYPGIDYRIPAYPEPYQATIFWYPTSPDPILPGLRRAMVRIPQPRVVSIQLQGPMLPRFWPLQQFTMPDEERQRQAFAERQPENYQRYHQPVQAPAPPDLARMREIPQDEWRYMQQRGQQAAQQIEPFDFFPEHIQPRDNGFQ